MKMTERSKLFGEAVFTTILVKESAPVFLKDHLKRLDDSVRVLFSCELNQDHLAKQIFEQAKEVEDGTVRVDLSWCQKGLGLDFSSDGELVTEFKLSFQSKGKHQTEIKVGLSPRRLGDGLFNPKIKTPNYLEYFTERKQSEFDELLYADYRNQLCEAGTSNVFIFKKGRWLTPKLNSNVLPGIVRKNILAMDKRIIEEEFSVEKLDVVEEMILTNCRNPVRIVTEFNGRAMATIQSISLKEKFEEYMTKKNG